MNPLALPYDWVLFDADDTLFRFDAYTGLKRMFADYGIDFCEQDHVDYQAVNKPLWVDYQNGLINAQAVQCRRFDLWAERLQVSASDLNQAFLVSMAEICTPLAGAVSLLDALQGKARLGIITNGFTQLQQERLIRTGLKEHFEFIVISEQVGVAKPHRDIFDHALTLMNHPPRERVLMVGDNPDSDILGGINAGLITCWLNPDNKPTPAGITPHHQVASLHELEQWLLPSVISAT